MNAQTNPTSSLTTVAITNEAALRVLARGPIVGAAAVAHASGLAQKNMARQLDLLVRDGLVREEAAHDERGRDAVQFGLTAAGRLALQAMDLAAGRLELGGEGAAAEPAGGVLLLPHHQIRRNPLNARKLDLADPAQREDLDRLKAQIVAAGDVLQNLVVFPADPEGIHTLSAGERRWTAVGELIEEGLWPRDRPLRAIERENSPGQTAFISLVENSQVALTVLERARAYEALCADTGWSAREAALRTGWDVKSVQQYLQVLRKADPAHIAAHEAGDPAWKWEALRESVQEGRDLPADAEDVQLDVERETAATAEKGDWSAPMRGALKVFRFNEISLTVDKCYALAEVNHKQRVGGFAAFGRAAAKLPSFARHDNNFKSLVTNGYLCWGRDHEGQDYAQLTDHGEAWLQKSDYPPDFRLGKYRTAWLNEQEQRAPIIGGGATQGIPKPKPEPEQRELTAYEALVLLELAKATDVAVLAGKDLGAAWVKVGKYWLDTAASELRNMGLVSFSHAHANGPHAGVLALGRARLEALGYTVPFVTDEDLAQAREAADPQGSDGQGYVTSWLNPTPAAEAAAAQPEPGDAAAGEPSDADDEYSLAADLLADVARQLDNADDPDPTQLFYRAGIRFPLQIDADERTIVGFNRDAILDVTGHGDLPDDLIKARLLLIVTALNAYIGDWSREPAAKLPAHARKPDDPAVPIRRSITSDDLICLEDGGRFVDLGRHLRATYGLTPDAYRERWGLPRDYPMAAPDTMKRRYQSLVSLGAEPTYDDTEEDEA